MSAQNPIDLSQLFTATASAASNAQYDLDRNSLDNPYRVHAIPRVEVSAQFEAIEDKQHRVFFFFGSKTRQSTSHTLNFTLLASPDPPPAVASAMTTNVTQPAFVVPPETRDDLLATLFYSLGDPDILTSAFPGGVQVRDFSGEIDEICHVIKNQDDDSIGLVFLRVGDNPPLYLVVRLGKHPEGVFLIDLTNERPVTVYSCRGAGKTMFYKPLQMAIQRFRDYLSSALLWQPGGNPMPDRFGAISMASLISGLWSGYVQARQQLADPAQVPGSPFPIGYELNDIRMALRYEIPRTGELPTDSPFVASRVDISVANLEPVVAVRLISPEYLLEGDARSAFLDLLQQRIEDDILPGFDLDDASPYREAFADRNSSARSVVLLSYTGATPQNQFLVVWSVSGTSGVAEFAFTCAISDDRFEDVHLTFGLQDPGSLTLDANSYLGFHNFLHAARIWDMASGWTIPVSSTGCR